MRGKLRIYLGAAPGVGKTYAMLNEGWRRRERGTDVVAGLIVTHGRPNTSAQIRDLEVVPPRRMAYRGVVWEELDTDAILARRPAVVLVDELAHTTVPGSRNEKRWQDIEELLAAGIEVISTLNIQHLESLNDVVNRITGVVQRETVPDVVVRGADQVELVDMSPEALRRRMAHGNIYPPEKVDGSLANFFRLGNLGALRELALLWVADRVEDSLHRYMVQHGIVTPWETRERVLVAMTGAPGGDDLIRRAARMARRTKGDLIGLHISGDDGLAAPEPSHLARDKRVLEELGGSWHEVVASDVPSAMVAFATAHHATQIVLGTSRRSRWTELTRGSVINRVVREAKGIDVHVIATAPGSHAGRGRSVAPIANADRRRRMLGASVLAVVAIGLVAALLSHYSALDPRHAGALTSSAGLLIFLGVVALVAVVGGTKPAMVTIIAAVVLVDWYLIPPYRSFGIELGADAAYVAAFVVMAVVATLAVDRAARRRAEASHLRQEADLLGAMAAHLGQTDSPQPVVDQIAGALDRRSVALLAPSGEQWEVEASSGEPVLTEPTDGEHYELHDGRVLVMTGPALDANEQRLVASFASYLEAVVVMHRLQVEASTAARLTQATELRNSLLAAVSHDLRTPLASIKALTSGWLEPDVDWTPADTQEFIGTIDAEADRLHKLVENLLDMSRLQAGALELTSRRIGLDELVPAALASLGGAADDVVIDVPEDLPHVEVDPALLERAIANVVDNATRHGGRQHPVRIEADAFADRIDLRVVDRGGGIDPSQRELVFRPFQRLGDVPNNTGVGLGLAVARGFVDAVGGELAIEDTPGGGVTMVIGLPVAVEEVVEERV